MFKLIKRTRKFLKRFKFFRSVYEFLICSKGRVSDFLKRFPVIKKSHRWQEKAAERYFSSPFHEAYNFSGPERICFYNDSKARQLGDMLGMIKINLDPEKRFQAWIDEGLFTPNAFKIIDNMPPNFELVIKNSIEDLRREFQLLDNPVAKNNVIILDAMREYIMRIAKELESLGRNDSAENFRNMLNHKSKNLEEALQRILLWSSVFWQSHHRLIGLGRLDKILAEFIEPEQSRERIELIKEFSNALHKHYSFKSNLVSKGDTGQIIIIGGLEPDGNYFSNELTYEFISAFLENKLPDPKLLLRVSKNMPEDLLRLAVDCISTGIGCPLLSDDDKVIPALEEFSYTHEDACNYVSSACWEPLAFGKSLEQNNIGGINYAKLITKIYCDKNFTQLKNFEELMNSFEHELRLELKNVTQGLNKIKWEEDPLMSLFTQDCLEKGKDISQGGAVYSNYGILTVGMSNAVNSLLNLKHLVFESRRISLAEVRQAALKNFPDYGLKSLLDENKYYGRDNPEIINLTNRINNFVDRELKNYRNPFGGRVKFGLSSPNYVEEGRFTRATLDGRNDGGPLGVHISNPKGVPYTELVMFASQLDYSGAKSNGNVLDYFVSPAVISKEPEKFFMFMKAAIAAGFFQMQLNVVDSEKLIDAKNNPGKYPDLIVRVWGFSAYFDELPEDYKNVLIERALACEGRAA